MMLVVILPGISTESEAIPGFTPTEYLIPNATLSCDLHMADGNLNSVYTAVDGEPGTPSATYWETNNSYLYWGNLSSVYDETGDRGVGTAIFHLSEPLGVSSTGYWQLSVTSYTAFPSFSADWTNLGHVTVCDASNEYHGYDLGIGYTSVNRGSTLVHSQMAHTTWSESSWGIDGSTGNIWDPPSYWFRPDTGSQWWDTGNNTLQDRAWSTAEVYNLVVIIQMRLTNEAFTGITKDGGNPVALAVGGLRVAIAPSPYAVSETTEVGGGEIFGGMYYIIPLMAVFCFSAASAFVHRQKGFIMNVFLSSIVIGLSLLIWADILANYFVILPAMLVTMMWLGKFSGNENGDLNE